MSDGNEFDAKRFTAASLCLQGLLSGTGLLRVPTDEMTDAYAQDAIRFADALLHSMEDAKAQPYRYPASLAATIYPEDARQFPAEGEYLPASLEVPGT